ncbi:MAG: histidine phosphatase family protein [Kiloniellales bacterium]
MAELYLVRHGQAGSVGGDYDRISDLGRRQSSLLGAHLAELGLSFDRVARGDLRRHAETLDPLLAALGYDGAPEVLPGLNEYDFHNVAEAYFAERPEPANFRSDKKVFFRSLRKALLAWSRDELPAELLRESWQDFSDRVADALERLCDPAKGERVLAVSSGGAISMALSQILGLTPEVAVALNLQAKNSGFSRFIFNGKAIYLHSFNAAPHLETPERQALVTFS